MLYGDRQPRHYGTALSHALGGNEPLQGVSAYHCAEPIPHWHFVTYGFSELHEKESGDPEVSGYGFELTLRLRDDGDSAEPPMWALNFLQNLARYVFGSGNVFEAGHYLNANGPIALGRETRIRSVAFVHDPLLAPIATENGRVEFLQVVGLTDDEEAALKRWSADKALEVYLRQMPSGVIDLTRASLLEDPAIAALLHAGAARDGSSTAHIFIGGLSWRRRKRWLRASVIEVGIGAREVRELRDLLPLRLAHGRSFDLIGDTARVSFVAGANAVLATDEGLRIAVDERTACEIATLLQPRAGTYAPASVAGLTFRVDRSEIRDSTGRIVETIG